MSERDRPPGEQDEEFETREERLNQRELGLDRRAEQLNERQTELDEREQELRDRREELAEMREDLENREERIQTREGELDSREEKIKDAEEKLTDRAEELEEKEETLEEYVGGTVEDAVTDAMEGFSGGQSRSRFGPIGALLIGIVGLTLVVGGVANGIAVQAGTLPTLLPGQTSNLAVSAVLILAGLAANLAAATSRV